MFVSTRTGLDIWTLSLASLILGYPFFVLPPLWGAGEGEEEEEEAKKAEEVEEVVEEGVEGVGVLDCFCCFWCCCCWLGAGSGESESWMSHE